MQVPSYQMHNVLNHYSRRLSRHVTIQSAKKSGGCVGGAPVELSRTGKRRAGQGAVSNQIFNKIKEVFLRCRASQPPRQEPVPESDADPAHHFVYNVIDPVNHQKTNRRIAGDSNFVLKGLEETEEKKVGSRLASRG
jgi:hypothetical protein